MAMACKHDIRETKRGTGECRIVSEVRKRNGKENWWCHTHGLAASAPDGSALPTCSGAWLDPIPDEQRLDLDLSQGEVAVWGAVPPAITLGDPPEEAGGVHVHRRPTAGQSKDIDDSFDIVTVRNGKEELVIEGTAAIAFSISELTGREVTPLTCTHCGEVHIDEKMFATYPHAKHLCNSCGRNFFDKQASISNPLAQATKHLGLPASGEPVRAQRALQLRTSDHQAIALWPTNAAIVSTMSRPEEEGIHVHAWDADGNQVIDETYSPVEIDGHPIDETQLRLLSVQRALAHGAPIVALNCTACQQPLTTPTDTWLEPTTTHSCGSCGQINRTRRRSFLNPLAAQFPPPPL